MKCPVPLLAPRHSPHFVYLQQISTVKLNCFTPGKKVLREEYVPRINCWKDPMWGRRRKIKYSNRLFAPSRYANKLLYLLLSLSIPSLWLLDRNSSTNPTTHPVQIYNRRRSGLWMSWERQTTSRPKALFAIAHFKHPSRSVFGG